MRKIKSTVTYTVPHWNYCNSDEFADIMGKSKRLCQFCVKTRTGYTCTLYNQPLSATDGEVHKVRDCCRATAGYTSNIDSTPRETTVDPKDIIAATISLYIDTVESLKSQGYPQQLAEQIAKKDILG